MINNIPVCCEIIPARLLHGNSRDYAGLEGRDPCWWWSVARYQARYPSDNAIPHLSPPLLTEELSDLMVVDCSNVKKFYDWDTMQWANYVWKYPVQLLRLLSVVKILGLWNVCLKYVYKCYLLYSVHLQFDQFMMEWFLSSVQVFYIFKKNYPAPACKIL